MLPVRSISDEERSLAAVACVEQMDGAREHTYARSRVASRLRDKPRVVAPSVVDDAERKHVVRKFDVDLDAALWRDGGESVLQGIFHWNLQAHGRHHHVVRRHSLFVPRQGGVGAVGDVMEFNKTLHELALVGERNGRFVGDEQVSSEHIDEQADVV